MDEIFNPQSLPILKVFGDGDNTFVIPDYQRNYSWGDEQVDRLYDDLCTAYKNFKEDPESDPNYFLGSLIVIKTRDSKIEEVVDGQQRLTTLIIFLHVIRARCEKKKIEDVENEERYGNLVNKLNFCIQNFENVKRIRLQTDPKHQSDLDERIYKNRDILNTPKPSQAELNSSEKVGPRFSNSAAIFKDNLLQSLEEDSTFQEADFYTYILERVKLIKITCNNQSFAIKLFQVLNDRGLDLSPSDLIKSGLIGGLPNDGIDRKPQFMTHWNSCRDISAFIKTNLTELFTFYEYYKLAKNPQKSLAEELGKIFKEERDSIASIADFQRFIEAYRDHIAEKTGDEVIYSLRYLKWSVHWRVILVTAKHTNYPDYLALAKAIRRFYYLSLLAGKTLGFVKQTSFNLISWVKKGEPIGDIKAKLQAKLNEKEVVQGVLQNLKGDLYHQPWCRALLAMVEYNLVEASNHPTFLPLNDEIHVEHVMPQDRNRDPDAWSHISDQVFREYLNSAGNLTLLGYRKNIQASNYSFTQKMKAYRGATNSGFEGVTSFRISQLIVDQSYENANQWTEQTMRDRYNWLITQVGKILEIDISNILKIEEAEPTSKEIV